LEGLIMETAQRFVPLTVESAPAAAQALLRASQASFGFLPSPVARAAHAPALLKHLLAGFAAFEQTSLAPLEREVVAFAVAYEVECHYCVALHTALLVRGEGADEGMIAALRSGAPLADPRLEALRRFVRAIVGDRGRPAAEHWQALDRAGFSEEQALEALLGACVYLTSTLTNVLTGAELDAPFEAFRWQKK
jgi:AhpD family alkylhydroperoxidase